jgi:glycosyltransferase involved in cell wall biosynthesis
MKKFALISLGLPPSQSGQSMVLYHLLKEFDPQKYCLITLKNFHQYKCLGNCSTQLKAKYFFLHPDYQIVRLMTKTASLVRSALLLEILLKLRIYQVKKILQKEQCKVVIGCTGDLFDPPAAFFAGKELGIPFILYTFDFYSRQWIHPVLREFSEKKEREMINGPSQVIVPNECLKQEYFQKYGIEATVIHNPFDLAEYEQNAKITRPDTAHDPKIVYTGAIYDAHFTAFHNLIAAIEKTGIPNLKLHIYTPQSISYLKNNFITGPVEIHKHLPNNQMPGVQRDADILFLPLAFNSPYPEIIKTSAPGKIGEYLAAKKPVLVHAPSDSFISWYFRKYSCGLVVDKDDPGKLAQEIIRLLSDKKMQKQFSENAYSRARDDFDLPVSQKKIYDMLNL